MSKKSIYVIALVVIGIIAYIYVTDTPSSTAPKLIAPAPESSTLPDDIESTTFTIKAAHTAKPQPHGQPAALDQSAQSPKQDEPDPKVPIEPEPVEFTIGNPNAPIYMIEYSSLTCGHCGQFHKETFEKIKENFIKKGKVYHITREFAMDPISFKLAMLVFKKDLSNDQKANTRSALMRTQEKWLLSNTPYEKGIGQLRFVGITLEDAENAQNDPDLKQRLLAQRLYASNALDVHATPTFIIFPKGKSPQEGIQLTGSLPYENFVSTFQQLPQR